MAIRFERVAVAACLALIGCSPAEPDRRSPAAQPGPKRPSAPAAASAPAPPTLRSAGLSPFARVARDVETSLLARNPPDVWRRGDTLFVRTGAGVKRFETEYCDDGDDDRCTYYRLDQVWENGRYFGIMVGFYEGSDYLLVARDGAETWTGDRPVPSPGRRWLASAVHNDAYETEREGVHIYDAKTLRVVHAIPPDRLMYPEELAWNGDACLGFRAALPADWQRKRHWWLAESGGAWRLSRNRPGQCR